MSQIVTVVPRTVHNVASIYFSTVNKQKEENWKLNMKDIRVCVCVCSEHDILSGCNKTTRHPARLQRNVRIVRNTMDTCTIYIPHCLFREDPLLLFSSGSPEHQQAHTVGFKTLL